MRRVGAVAPALCGGCGVAPARDPRRSGARSRRRRVAGSRSAPPSRGRGDEPPARLSRDRPRRGTSRAAGAGRASGAEGGASRGGCPRRVGGQRRVRGRRRRGRRAARDARGAASHAAACVGAGRLSSGPRARARRRPGGPALVATRAPRRDRNLTIEIRVFESRLRASRIRARARRRSLTCTLTQLRLRPRVTLLRRAICTRQSGRASASTRPAIARRSSISKSNVESVGGDRHLRAEGVDGGACETVVAVTSSQVSPESVAA